jgi:D-glycero-D-manno-heptose 1,7-bisphosphate phosphatase
LSRLLKKCRARRAGLIHGGVYVLSRDILSKAAPACSLETNIFPIAAAEGALEGAVFSGYFLDIGLPETLAQAQSETAALLRRPAVVLDRDGVLNHDEGYTHRDEDLRWNQGAREAVKLLNDRGYYVLVAANQAGVARGLYDEAAIGAFHERMQEQLHDAGAHLDGFYYCPFHPDALIEAYRHPNHPDRKPNPGMIQRAFAEWPVEAERSFLIGDRDSDIQAAHAAGLRGWLYNGGDLMALVSQILKTAD